MRYWDTSALVPLIVSEPHSGIVRQWLAEDDGVLTWVWTRVEITSAIERRARQDLLLPEERRRALDRVAAYADAWDDIADVLAVRVRAIRLLGRHVLRAADAGQLGAALLVLEYAPQLTFVCLDQQLAHAAEREGLEVLTRSR